MPSHGPTWNSHWNWGSVYYVPPNPKDLSTHLRRSHLRVGPSNLDARVETGPVVGLDHLPPEDLVRSHTAVVGSLRAQEPVLRPAERVPVPVHQQVLLLHPEPGLLRRCLAHHGGALVAVVGAGGCLPVGEVGGAEHQSVGAAQQRVGEVGHRLQHQIRVVALGLAGGGAVVRPRGVAVDRRRLVGQGASLRAEVLPRAVHPDVGGLTLGGVGPEAEELVHHRRPQREVRLLSHWLCDGGWVV